MKFLFLLMILFSCNNQNKQEQAVLLNPEVGTKNYESDKIPEGGRVLESVHKSKKDLIKLIRESDHKNIQKLQGSRKDDFGDIEAFDKKQEACDTEEDIEKKLMEKKSKPFLLNPKKDEGCSVK